MKQIKAFRHESYGLFLDLKETPGSVAIDPETGNLQLNEGDGPDCYQGAFIPAASVRDLCVNSIGSNQYEVVLDFGTHDSHQLGQTIKKSEAEDWVQKALEALGKRKFVKVPRLVPE